MESESAEEEVERLWSRSHGFSRDLLQRFGSTSCFEEQREVARGDPDEIELSLGLSLGGCFGPDSKEKKLVRSSSIASLSMLPKEQEFPVVRPIARTCSLPTEAEEEQRKRKEMQSLRRLEAKRKRLERRSSRSVALPGRDRLEEGLDDDMERSEVEVGGGGGGVVNGVVGPGLSGWPTRPGRAAEGARGFGPISQGSIASQGSSSSSISDFEARAMQENELDLLPELSSANNITHSYSSPCIGYNTRSPATIQPLPESINHKLAAIPQATQLGKQVNSARGDEDPPRRNSRRPNGVTDMERSMMEEMPCVSTRGDGPNGRRIEGFLYKYRKGEEVRIVCVCHGSFLTPAEFVKHAGGGDVAHPLRHIVVNPSPSAFL